MAELIELRKERMLPELEQMKRIQLFEDHEIRDIIKERDVHSYRIQRLTKSLRDYLQFIKFEKNLVALVRERRKVKHIPQKKANIEMAILNRIKILYKQTVHRFPEHVAVWDEYIQFCKVYKFGTEVPAILDRMLQFHADKPETWQKAVMWEYEEAKNKDRVKHFILGGLQRHPKNETLYFTFFKLKLLEGNRLQSAENIDADEREEAEKKCLAQAELIYKDGKENIASISFVVGMLDVVAQFKYARVLEALILDDMRSTYGDSELMWHTLAKMELAGRHLQDISSNTISTAPTDPIKCIEMCVTIYETACEKLDTEDMWSYFLGTLLDLKEVPEIPEEVKQKQIVGAFSVALEKGKISQENFLKLMEIASENPHWFEKEKLESMLDVATGKYPSSVTLWEVKMRFYIEYQQVEDVDRVFRMALKKVALKDSFPLWELLVLYYKSDASWSKKVKAAYKEAIDTAVMEIANQFKPQFLEYLVQTEGIEVARKEYQKLCLVVPSSLELHKQMSQLEAMQGTANIDAWRRCHEMATQFFGKEKVDVWLEIIRFERSHGDPKRVSQLYQRAMNSLDNGLVGTFITEYNLKINKF